MAVCRGWMAWEGEWMEGGLLGAITTVQQRDRCSYTQCGGVDGKANKYEELFEGKANVIFFVGFHIWRLGDKKRKKPRSVSRFQERNYGINWDGENLY